MKRLKRGKTNRGVSGSSSYRQTIRQLPMEVTIVYALTTAYSENLRDHTFNGLCDIARSFFVIF